MPSRPKVKTFQGVGKGRWVGGGVEVGEERDETRSTRGTPSRGVLGVCQWGNTHNLRTHRGDVGRPGVQARPVCVRRSTGRTWRKGPDPESKGWKFCGTNVRSTNYQTLSCLTKHFVHRSCTILLSLLKLTEIKTTSIGGS